MLASLTAILYAEGSMQRQRRDEDDLMIPIVFAVLGFFALLGITGQLLGKYLTHRNPIVATAPQPAAEPKQAVAPPATTPAIATPQPAAPPAADAKPPPPPPPVKAVPANPPPVAAPASGALAKLALDGGTVIEASGSGVESKLLGFIKDPNTAIDKATWFDFDRLNFETGSAKLTADSKAQVDNIAAILNAYPAVKIKIGGYTDNTGNANFNMKLSGDRAKAVVDALSGLGIAADRLESEGYGSKHPIADNATPEGRAKNRRIAVSVRAK